MENLRAAVIGIGFVGRAHVEALRRLGVPVAGILGSCPNRTKDSANSLRLDRAYSSLEELAGDKEVDVVHICTPNHLHHDQANALLKAQAGGSVAIDGRSVVILNVMRSLPHEWSWAIPR